MRCTTKFFCASLITFGTLFAQGGPPLGFGGPGGPGGPGFGGPGPGGPPVTGAPFSATKTDTHQETLSDGNAITQTRTEKLYRDADGRTRTEATMTSPSGPTKTMITISDPVAGFVAHLNPTDSTAFKMTLHTPPLGTPPTRPTPPANTNGPTVAKSDLGGSTLDGLAITGTSTTITFAAGTIGNSQPIVETREVWVSTALKIPVKMTSTDPRHGTSSMIFSVISQTAPDPSLFQIPSTYTVKDAPAHAGPHGGPGGPGFGGPGPGGPPPADDSI